MISLLSHSGNKMEEGTPQAQQKQVEIAKEPSIGKQLPSKDKLFGFHPQKDRANESYSGVSRKPQDVEQVRKLFPAHGVPLPLSCLTTFPLAVEAGNHTIPLTTKMDLGVRRVDRP